MTTPFHEGCRHECDICIYTMCPEHICYDPATIHPAPAKVSELTRGQVEALVSGACDGTWCANCCADGPCTERDRSVLATALLAAWDAVGAAQTYINDVLGVPSPDFLATIAAREATEEERDE